MIIDIAWWDLDGSGQTIDSLRPHLAAAAPAWADVPGLCLKCWMADREHNTWGAVMLWKAGRPARAALPPNRAAELIGVPPGHRLLFTAETVVPGRAGLPARPGPGGAAGGAVA